MKYSVRYSDGLYGSWPYNLITEYFDTLEEAKAFIKEKGLKANILYLREKDKRWVKWKP